MLASDKNLLKMSQERTKIRDKISSLSFLELLKIKEEMGSKLYNETVFGPLRRNREKEFKRVNKNRPREVSSKLRPKQINEIFTPNVTVNSKRSIVRDPRFDRLCGQFDEKCFKDNYKFVSDIQQKEKEQLENEIKECSDSERKKVLRFLIQRLDNRIRQEKKTELKNKKEFKEKLEAREKLKNGEMPIFKKKSVKKLEDLIEKFESLKKSNRIQKHIERKSKKQSSKDRKKLKHQQF